MKSVESFAWKKGEEIIATLEVRHQKCEMVLNVKAPWAETVRNQMVELGKGGLYPNEETTRPNNSFAQFIISGGYNWNARWRDFRTTINQLLNTHFVEAEQVEEM